MIIKKSRLKDVKNILILWKDFMDEHQSLIDNSKVKKCLKFKKGYVKVMERYIRNNIKSKNAVIFIAKIGSKAIGFAIIKIKNNILLFKLEKIGYISDLYVKKGYRNKKISTKLKNKILEWSKNKNLKYISIGLFPENILARKIYSGWGFFEYHLEMRKKI